MMERSEFIVLTLGAAAVPAVMGAPNVVYTTLQSAPFPHASRASGHTYQKKLYDAAAHYSDRTVGIFKPPGYVDRDTVDFIVHFHGWNNHVRQVFERYNLAAQVTRSNVNAILVVPQGPLDAPDSGDGKLELDDNGFARFMQDVTAYLNAHYAVNAQKIGRIVLTTHSGGYGGAGGVLTRGGMNDRITDVILF
ncbi:MAG: hypothetical protein M3126_05925, partial [Candidatus Eremiobacteraeota bacterium]|nr:hypothetical protein [Candidatus Eremiobacteraeota bacterium]